MTRKKPAKAAKPAAKAAKAAKPAKKSTYAKYNVALRRDVQQVAHVVVDAWSRQEAIDIAEAWVDEDRGLWKIEEHIGTHKPEVKLKDQ